MQIDDQIKALTTRVESLIREEPGIFLVEVRIKPTNNVKVFLDADAGVNLDKLIQYNRRLYRQLEEETFFPGNDFSLEVSSPGLDEPIKLNRQYQKNIGRFVEVLMEEGSKVEGKLLAASDEELTVEEEKGKGKKKEIIQHKLLLGAIKTTKIQVKF